MARPLQSKKGKQMKQPAFWMLAFAATLMTQATAQQVVFPAKGQSAEQQKSDESACGTPSTTVSSPISAAM